MRTGLLLVLSLLLSTACSNPPAPPSASVALRDGRTIPILAAGPLRFGDGTTALLIKYETRTAISDVPALRAEAQELWSILEAEVAPQGYRTVILSANTPSTGALIESSKGYNFQVVIGADGVWRLQSPGA